MLRDPVARLLSAYWYYGCLYGIYKHYGEMGPQGFHAFAQVLGGPAWGRVGWDSIRCSCGVVQLRVLTQFPGSQRMCLKPRPRLQDQLPAVEECLRDKSGSGSGDAAAAACAVSQFGRAQQVVKGWYAPFMEAWLAVYPRDQILVIHFESYKADPAAHVASVLDFLGLPAPGAEALAAAAGVEANRGHSRSSAVPGCGGAGRREGMLPETEALLREFYRPLNRQLADLLGDERFAWSGAAV